MFLKLIFPPKGELFTCANTGSSGCFGLFTPKKNQNTGRLTFWIPRNPTEKRSRTLVGISRSIIVASSSVAVSRDAKVAKKRSSEVTFCSRCLRLFASNLIVWIPALVGTSRNARFIVPLLLALSHLQRSNFVFHGVLGQRSRSWPESNRVSPTYYRIRPFSG